jgi:hypothetical protein
MNGDYAALDDRISRLERELSAAHAEIRVLRFGRAVPRLFYATIAAAVLVASNSTPSAQGAGGKVKAPFTVVDDKGVAIFQVRSDTRGFALSNPKGVEVAYGTANDTVTMFKVRSVDNARQTALGLGPSFIGVNVRLNEKLRATLGLGGNLMPSLEMFTSGEKLIVTARQSLDSGGGFLSLNDAGGIERVTGGVDPAGVGLVQSHPGGSPGAGLVGMPGTFIRGREGGK